ncbi:MAG: PBP1A family penicillin-binding protein [Desulfobacterales bacterium]|nr:PBP1A family penicillin-binding protein [Desulfobacterales bacterium]
MWIRSLKWIIGILIFVLGCLILYGGYLSIQIENRFSSRRWSIPSKVFSDITLLYPGQFINLNLFNEMLQRLEYQEVPHQPKRKGELHTSKTSIDIFLHDIKTPSLNREGFPVQIRFNQNQIESIIRTDKKESIPILELEPEEIVLFFGPERERRQLVSIDQLPKHLIFAVLAAEDARFYRHYGVDPFAILRAFYTNLIHGAIRQGGSTITQQLTKNYFLTPEKTISRKLNELMIALIIEAMYTKDTILEIYLNEIYLGQKGSVSINGIGEAAYFYFGKPVSELSTVESATIAGLIRGPNHYSPYADKTRCLKRRNQVLSAMHRNGWISAEELQLDLSLPVNPAGFTLHGRKAPYFIDYLTKQLENLYPAETLYSQGLSIYTTLDTQVQTAAEKALEKGLIRLEKSNSALKREDPLKQLQGAIIVMQPKTGDILAMVGGRNYNESQFNRIAQARRQPGSLFKPFVYVTALDQFTPASILSNAPQSYEINGKLWQPQNFEITTEEHVRLRTALKKSYNLATIDLAMQIGLNRIVKTATEYHFSTPLQPYPSLALGAFEMIPIEIARAYCVFAADGVQTYPLSLKSVSDENGKIIQRKHMKIERLISPAKAFLMNSMLESVVTEGTAQSLKNRGIAWPLAGKTGTTNNYRDAWFVGYTPDILALVWVGFDNGDPVFATGSAAALPIWADLITAIPHCISKDGFNMPTGVVKKSICAESGELAIKNRCPTSLDEFFLAENVPMTYCKVHQKYGVVNRFTRGIKNFINKF